MTPDIAPVTLGPAPVTLDDLLAVADGAAVAWDDAVTARLVAARDVVDEAIARGDAIYGTTTGVGHARDERVPVEALRAFQPQLVEMHVGGLGGSMPTEVVRAGMAARLVGFTRGGSGVSVPLARGLASLLNHGIHPHVPERGSLGAGDLGQLAYVARALLGRGTVEWNGADVNAADALREAGVDPVVMEPKDALAAISANSFSIGRAALTIRRAEQVLERSDLVVAVSMEAWRANRSVVDEVVASVRGGGQERVSSRIRAALGDDRTNGDSPSVQDPLSIRVVPQVHGAFLDAVAVLTDAVVAELNAPSDNPLVDVESRRIVSNGNFHAMTMAIWIEAVRIALCHVGLLAERRMGQLFDRTVESLAGGPPPGTPPAMLAGLGLRYPAAARYTRLRQLAQPVTLDVGPTDLGVEDHAPNTAEALSALAEMLEIVDELVAIELMVAMPLLTDQDEHLGPASRRLVATVRDVAGTGPPGRTPDQVLTAVRAAIEPLDR